LSNIARCRVSLEDLGKRGKFNDNQKNTKTMLAIFRKMVNDSGIMTTYKQNQFYESKGEKRRRKKKEMINNVKRDRLRSHFANPST